MTNFPVDVFKSYKHSEASQRQLTAMSESEIGKWSAIDASQQSRARYQELLACALVRMR